jgi:hypothetical protein
MKKVILLLLILPVPLFCQVTDNFETGRLNKWVESISGHWKADSINPLNGKYALHHVFDNPDAGNDQIGIPITNLKPSMGVTKWSFKLRHGYDPSSSNNWGVFLISDNVPSSMLPGGNVNGYVIGVNLTGYDDTLRLCKIKNGSVVPYLNTGINWQNNIGTNSLAIVNVERSNSGEWRTKVFSKDLSLIDSASGIEVELFNSEWFGVYYKYTSTRDRLLWVDDIAINGVFYEDKEPPEVRLCAANSPFSVDITLNEEPGTGFFSAENFTADGTQETALSVIKLTPQSIRIMFKGRFINKSENTILIRSLCDKAGNCNQNVHTRFTPVWADPGDVVISEIMADPLPPVSLPEKEYIEIFNRTIFQLNLKNWKLSYTGGCSVFPETLINPGERIILCQVADTSSFSKYGRVKGIKSFPVLTDGGRLIVLSDSSGNMIHGIDYKPGWYGDNLKGEGGWSLEMIDTGFPFCFEENWTASVSKKGGTPGSTNSVSRANPDFFFKGIINAFPNDSGYLDVIFSEPVKNISGNISGIRINENAINSIIYADPLMREFLLKPGTQFTEHQKYSLSIPGSVTDFAGNSPRINSFTFGISEKAINGDITFNEILFNPLPGDADYIELFNSSSKTIDASELLLASVNETGIYSSTVPVSSGHRCILPCTYYTITTDRESLLNRYFTAAQENIFSVSQLPSMPDDKGHLVLFNRQLEVIDELSYSENMHYSLLSGYEGIALEKVRPIVLSADPKSWHSASETSGWGTPGAPNSIYSLKPQVDTRIILSSTRITPDNDGNEDLLVIDMNLEGSGNVVTITVFDETGGFVLKLAGNLLAGTKASVIWDGTADDGSLVRSGIYILLISVFDDTGKSVKWKKVCSVIR